MKKALATLMASAFLMTGVAMAATPKPHTMATPKPHKTPKPTPKPKATHKP